jgi:hypothetical protein
MQTGSNDQAESDEDDETPLSDIPSRCVEAQNGDADDDDTPLVDKVPVNPTIRNLSKQPSFRSSTGGRDSSTSPQLISPLALEGSPRSSTGSRPSSAPINRASSLPSSYRSNQVKKIAASQDSGSVKLNGSIRSSSTDGVSLSKSAGPQSELGTGSTVSSFSVSSTNSRGDLESQLSRSTQSIQSELLSLNLDANSRVLATTMVHLIMLKLDPFMAETGRKLIALESKMDALETQIKSRPQMTAIELLKNGYDPYTYTTVSEGGNVYQPPPSSSLLATRVQKLAEHNEIVEQTKRSCNENPYLHAVTEQLEKGEQKLLGNTLIGKQLAAMKEEKDRRLESGLATGRKLIDLLPNLNATEGEYTPFDETAAEDMVVPSRAPCGRCDGIGFVHATGDPKKKHGKDATVQCRHCSSCSGTL